MNALGIEGAFSQAREIQLYLRRMHVIRCETDDVGKARGKVRKKTGQPNSACLVKTVAAHKTPKV
jgi:hypothetical protein